MFELNGTALYEELTGAELIAWDIYFSGLVAFQLHPGNHQDPAKIDITPYAKLADRMVDERRKRGI